MNNKGFTLIELLATIVIIVIVMGIVLPSALNVSRTNRNKIYLEYENMMVEYALINPDRGQSLIRLDDLDELDKVKNDGCVGYVDRISKNPLGYKAYIKCTDKYTTDGYSEEAYNRPITEDVIITYDVDGTLSIDTCSLTINSNNLDNSCLITLASAPKKKGYIFAGWKSSSNNSTYSAETEFLLSANLTMTAQWRAINASLLNYSNSKTHLECEDVQCALEKIKRILVEKTY